MVKSLSKLAKLIIFIIVILFLIVFFPKLNNTYQNVEDLIKNSGIFAPFIYVFLMIVAILVSPIPSSPLAIFGGAVFGPFLGMIYTLIGATIGAVLAFLVSRFFLRDYISRKLERNKFYKRIRGKDNNNIAKIILFTRLMPHISFDIVSYAVGLTSLNVWTFALVTFIGMIPIVFLLSFFGNLIEPYISRLLLVFAVLFFAYIFYLYLKKKK